MKSLIAGLVLATAGMSASAVPINFEFDGSSVDITNCLCLGGYSSNSGSATLDDGQSASFNFGTASTVGFGSGELTLTVDFLAPIVGGESVTGDFSVLSLFIASKGYFEGGSVDFNYTAGNYAGTARLTLDEINTGVQFGPSFDFTGSITNLGSDLVADVPEPGSLALLGLGLAGLGLSRRKLKAS